MRSSQQNYICKHQSHYSIPFYAQVCCARVVFAFSLSLHTSLMVRSFALQQTVLMRMWRSR